MKKGIVHIVGAGPGDPGLISVKGLHCLRHADVVLHDRLVHPKLLSEARAGAKLVDVGKRRGREDARQLEIHRLMIAYAQQGKIVCRLQGGDPFVFGRGGEEVAALISAGVPFEVIPGISSATAAPAAAGIPLTHRDHAHGFLVITGSRSQDFDCPEWRAARILLKSGGTVVVMMGLERLAEILKHLTDKGCPADLPVAVISAATWPNEEIRFGVLRNIQKKANDLRSPALMVIGSVVALTSHPEFHRILATEVTV